MPRTTRQRDARRSRSRQIIRGLATIFAASLILVAGPVVAVTISGAGSATAQDYETSPREEPENLEPPQDRSPEHSEGSTGKFPVAAVAIVIVAAGVLTGGYLWLRSRF